MAEDKLTEITREQCEEIFGPINDYLWQWIITHNRQQEILDSPAYDRGETRGFGTPGYFRRQQE